MEHESVEPLPNLGSANGNTGFGKLFVDVHPGENSSRSEWQTTRSFWSEDCLKMT